jgi:hypothetical protein
LIGTFHAYTKIRKSGVTLLRYVVNPA